MLSRAGWLCLLALSALFAGGTRAELLTVGAAQSLLPGAAYLVDREQLDVQGAASRYAQGAFSPADPINVYLGFTRAPVWLHFRVGASPGSDRHAVLMISNPLLDRIELFEKSERGYLRLAEVGDTLPYHRRPILGPNFAIPLLLAEGRERDYLLRISGGAIVRFKMMLFGENHFVDQVARRDGRFGLLTGALLSVAVAIALVWLVVRESLYGWFLLYVLGIGLLISIGYGYGYRWWPEATAFQQYVIALASGLTSMAYVKFVLQMLNVGTRVPWLERAANGQVMAMAVFLSLLPFIPLMWQTLVLIALTGGLLLTPAIGLVILWRQLVSIGGMLIAVSILFSLAVFVLQVLPSAFFRSDLDHLMALSLMQQGINVVLFTASAGYRFVLLRRQDQESERQALRAVLNSQFKSDFLARMSHEIRTPLNGVLGMAQLLDDSRLNEDQRKYLGMINTSGQALMGVVNDILDYSRIEAGQLQLVRDSVSIERLLKDVRDIFYTKSLERDVPLEMSVAPGVPTVVEADASRLRQVLVNLVSNAFKFTERGQVHLSVAVENDRLIFSVRDSGMGIRPDDMARLFSRFEQLESSGARRLGGSGLGLSICRQLVTLMGGEIGVSSAMAQGSDFHFWIPLLPVVGPNEVPQAAPRDSVVEARSLRVLVAEDNDVNWCVTRGLLKRLGHEAERALNGAEALAKLEQDPCLDLVLMDCEMPVMDGLEATRRIRAHESGRHLPVIALTAHATEDYRVRCLAVGMDACLVKPVTLHALGECLAHFGGGRA